jgi:hypothetical protein
VIGGFAVLSVEAASAFHTLNRGTIAAAWAVALAVAVAGRLLRGSIVGGRRSWPAAAADRRRPTISDAVGQWRTAARQWWAEAAKLDRFLVATIGGLLLAELVVAFLAAPNNFDSQTYHLARIEHWVAAGDVDPFPTAIHRQVSLAPGGEYLLTHLRLLTGSDGLYNLVQWAAGVLCLLAASRIAAQFGGGRRAQLLTAFVVATTPMVTLQASSTQVDLIVAGWTAALATLVLDGARTPVTWRMAGWLGVAAGLTAVTKTTGLLAAGPLLILWGLAQLRLAGSPAERSGAPGAVQAGTVGWRGIARTVAGSIGVLAVAALLAGPFIARNYAEFGDPLGSPRLTGSIPMQRHDPAAILANAVRIGQTALDTPLPPLSHAAASAAEGISRLVGVDPQDRAITFGVTRFPVVAWYPDEDRVSFPIQGTLALLGLGFCLARPRRFTSSTGLLRAYSLVVVVAGVLYAATIKWQPWGNRLIVFALVLAAPLAGLWLEKVLGPATGVCAGRDRRRLAVGEESQRRWPMRAAVVTLLVAALSATLAVGYGFPRRLVGHGSVFTTAGLDSRFLRRPQWEADFVWASDAIAASGAQRIGLVQSFDNWEYPWWVLLRGRELVALQSVLPEEPPADPTSVDAIVCTGDMAVCRKFVPAGWTLVTQGYVGYALPDASQAAHN